METNSEKAQRRMPHLSERKWENERGRHIASDMPVNSITLQFVRSICAMCVWVISLVVSLLFSTLMRFLFSISLSLSLILAHFCCWDLLLCVFFFFCSLFIKFPVLLVTAVISCIGKCFSIDSKLFSSVVFVSFFVFTTLVSLFNGLYNVHSHSDFAWYLLLAIYETMCECVRVIFSDSCVCVCVSVWF